VQTLRETLKEVMFAVLPITLVVIVLQFTLIWLPFYLFAQFLVGMILVIAGLTLFLMGVQLGILPVGEHIGAALPKTGKIWLVVLFGFLLGFVVTVAEPDVRVLATQVDLVSGGAVSKMLLIYTVALGVAIFVGLAMLRTLFGVPLPVMLVSGYLLIFALSAFTPSHYVPISFDAGGVTTGPMTVPFILALGVGMASVLRGKSTSADGFGLVALASIGPVLAVLLLGVFFG
jgi:hypothetical protein